MDFRQLCAAVEAILYVAGEPVNAEALAHALNLTRQEFESVIDQLQESLVVEGRGIRLNRHGGEIQFSINPDCAKYVEMFLQPVKKQTLSQAVLETLSIIAYRQPVTRADIEAIRGVK